MRLLLGLALLLPGLLLAAVGEAPADLALHRDIIGSTILSGVYVVPKLYDGMEESLGVSTAIASKLGLSQDFGTQHVTELTLFPGALQVQLRPCQVLSTDTELVSVAGWVSSLLVIPQLLKGQIILPASIPLEDEAAEGVVWDMTVTVRDFRRESRLFLAEKDVSFQQLLLAAHDMDAHSPKWRFHEMKRYLKRLAAAAQVHGRHLDDLYDKIHSTYVSRQMMGQPPEFVHALWQKLLEYNKRYLKGNIVVVWIAWLKFKRHLDLQPGLLFTLADRRKILLSILGRKARRELECALSDPRIMADLPNGEARAILAHIRGGRFNESASLAGLALEQLGQYYSLDWVRDDILTLMAFPSANGKDALVVRKFLDSWKARASSRLSRKWLGSFAAALVLLPARLNPVDWQLCDLFFVYISMLHCTLPGYFDQHMSSVLKDAVQDKKNPFAQTKDAVLELVALVPCLSLKPLHNQSASLHKARLTVRSSFAKLKKVRGETEIRVSLRNMFSAVDYYLHLTGFVDRLVMHRELRIEEPSNSIQVAALICKRLLSAFQWAAIKLRLGSTPDSLLTLLARFALSRLSLLMVWTRTVLPPVLPRKLLKIAKLDPYCMSSIIWAALAIDPQCEAWLDALRKALKGEPAAWHIIELAQVATQAPTQLRCAHDGAVETIRITLPRALASGLVDPDLAIALLRTLLLLKFSIPHGLTRSDMTLILHDLIHPFDYESFLNFWIERHCCLHCKTRTGPCRPSVRVVLEGIDVGDEEGVVGVLPLRKKGAPEAAKEAKK